MLLIRNPEAFTRPEFWAEDGANFFRESWNWGVGSLFYPLGGYQNLLPRLWAYSVSFLPVEWTPALYAYFALGISSFCLGYFARSSFAWLVPHYGVRLGVCCIFALAPGSLEVTQAICNLHTVGTLWVALWILEEREKFGWSQYVLFGLLVLSVPELPTVLPLLLYRWFTTRNTGYGVLAAMVLTAAIGNAVTSRLYRGESYGMELTQIPWALWVGAERFVLHAIFLPLFGAKVGGWWLQSGTLATVAGMIAGLGIWGWLWSRAPRAVTLGSVLLSAGALSFCLLVLARPYLWPLLDGPKSDTFWWSRYAFVSVGVSTVAWAHILANASRLPKPVAPVVLGLIFVHALVTPQRPEARPDVHWPATAEALRSSDQPVPVTLQPGAYSTILVPGRGG